MAKKAKAGSLGELAKWANIEFKPIGTPVDRVVEHQIWMRLFETIMRSRELGEMYPDQVADLARGMIDEKIDPADEIAPFEIGIARLKGAIAMLEGAKARLFVGMARAAIA